MKLKPVDFDPFAEEERPKVSGARLKLVEANPFEEPMNVDPTSGMSTFDKVAAGAGKRLYDAGRSIQQMLGMASQQEIDEAKRLDKALMDTTAGKVGSAIPDLATIFIPGAAGVKGAAIIGGGLAALNPTSEGESRALNVATGAALAGGTTYGLQKGFSVLADRVASKQAAGAQEAARNAVRDANLAAAKDAGYTVIPSEVGGGMPSQVLEGLSGKIKTQQLAAVKNQNVTDALVRKAVGLGPEDDLSLASMKAVRARAFAEGYEPVLNWGGGQVKIKPDAILQKEAAAITSRADNAAQAFGDIVKSDVGTLVEGLQKAQPFTPQQGLNATAIFREKASDAFAKGDKQLGRAYGQVAKIIEDQIDRAVSASGKEGQALMPAFREARKLMAKTFDVEKGLNAGKGQFDASVAGRILKKSPDRLTDELKTVGMAALSMPQATRMPQQGWSAPVTAMDTISSLGLSAASQNLLPLAIPAARVGARYGLLSRAGQKAIGPSYGPNALEKAIPEFLQRQEAQRLGLLAPLLYGIQQ